MMGMVKNLQAILQEVDWVEAEVAMGGEEAEVLEEVEGMVRRTSERTVKSAVFRNTVILSE